MKITSRILLLGSFTILLACQSSEQISYNTDIRPILNKSCLSCHGGVKQAGGFSLLFEEEAFAETESGAPAIVRGDHKASELYKRLVHHDPEERMPQEKEALTEGEIKLIAKWIDQGAKWEKHWAYNPPIMPETWTGNNGSVDHWVRKVYKEEGFEASPQADKSTLLRRVSLDLIGLPPTMEETEAFLGDESPEAYEELVDKLLASPHFGERWATMWLDLARYADSQGYQKDPLRRTIWRYRDYVIDALNKDMPFDQFTIEQLAGDLLPEADNNQLLATAFHRNTMTNDEGGTDDEEFRVSAVIDRLNTTFEVWQGTTMGCVQCHSHPYDPILHKEFYQLYAYFNNTADKDDPREKPVANLFSPNEWEKRKELESGYKELAAAGDTISQAYQKQLEEFLSIKAAKVPVMEELHDSIARKSFVFNRGNWLVHGEEVQPQVGAYATSMSEDYPANRLGLAQWLVDGDNALTSRVMVNRFWEQIFGQGLVSTVEDFGTMGEVPSHPELLDYLAVQFSDTHQWSVKSLLKEIVMSETYQQSSKVDADMLKRDPYNKYLARGPRFRLSAEQIRDQALTISGLLSRKLFGPSVMPEQPEGVWNIIRHVGRWKTSEDGDQHRRALYTFWRRASPYPSMISFDKPTRELCVSRRIRTNTPLQALITMNDPVYLEASTALAERMLNEGGNSLEEQINYAFKLALMRDIDPQRLTTLKAFYDQTLDEYRGQQKAKLVSNRPEEDDLEFKTLVNLANVILNLDELIMKG